jgi:hypothetical protein
MSGREKKSAEIMEKVLFTSNELAAETNRWL